jgi:AraC-like DNA-binding protein/quercetin dioxygenase-like cupin family protein
MKEKLKIRPGANGFAFLVEAPWRRIAPHHHDELEVNVVLTGRASYLFGNRRVPLPAHSMIWLFPGQEHVLIDWSHDFSMWVVVFKQELVGRETGQAERRILRSADPGEIFCREIAVRQVDLLSQVYQGAADGRNDLEFLNAALGYALVASWQAFQFSREPVPLSDVHPAVAKAARLIANADASIGLEALARDAGLSPARLSRLFKQQTGTSLTAFRQRQSLERFLRLYRTGARYSLIEAALLAGFGSYPQFHRVFCRLMGMNPAAYRKRVGETVK